MRYWKKRQKLRKVARPQLLACASGRWLIKGVNLLADVHPSLLRPHVAENYWQVLNLKELMFVLQLNVPLAERYSVVNTIVQPSTGSTLNVL